MNKTIFPVDTEPREIIIALCILIILVACFFCAMPWIGCLAQKATDIVVAYSDWVHSICY
jgi:hypothetical protein